MFDAVNHTLLIEAINATNLNSSLKRWIATYLRGRQCRVFYHRVYSPWRIIHTGVPQGSVLGPILFNFFVSDFPTSASLRESYADDFNVVESATKVSDLEPRLQADVDEIKTWADRKRLGIAPGKCNVTLFTPDMARESNSYPRVNLEDNNGQRIEIPLNKRPRLLGVTLDTHFCFGAHAMAAVRAAKGRLQTMRLLSGTSWGCNKETMTQTYKQYVEPVFTHAAPIWAPNASPSSILSLQRVQNAALRQITGCHSATRTEHLNQETKILPVAAKLGLLCSQFLASTLRPGHPSREVVLTDPGPRRKKETLRSKFGEKVEPFLTDGTIAVDEYRSAIKTLHTKAVTQSIEDLGENHLLNSIPPPIDDSELALNRPERTTLAQLRSGECHRLNDYMMKVGKSDNAICPECKIRRHTVPHFFAATLVPQFFVSPTSGTSQLPLFIT